MDVCVTLTHQGVPPLQLIGIPIFAQAVDEVAERLDIVQLLGHDHLLVNQVGLGQVGARLVRKINTHCD